MAVKDTIPVFWGEFCQPLAALDRCTHNKGVFAFGGRGGGGGGVNTIKLVKHGSRCIFWQTVEAQMKCHIMQHFFRVYTVC